MVEGIFRPFWICDTESLEDTSQTIPKNSFYTSSQIENEIFYICGENIQDGINSRESSTTCYIC